VNNPKKLITTCGHLINQGTIASIGCGNFLLGSIKRRVRVHSPHEEWTIPAQDKPIKRQPIVENLLLLIMSSDPEFFK